MTRNGNTAAALDPTSQSPRASAEGREAYERHVNPQWVRLLGLLQMDVPYTRCEGAELHTADGRLILDFLSGYCVHNAGHNHPAIVEALREELASCGPAMLQSHVPDLAGELAAQLCRRAGGRLSKASFCSSGSEGIEAVIKLARAHTRRPGLLYAKGAFHGLTCGALSLMGDDFWRRGFGEFLPGTTELPFGDLDALHRELKSKRIAALVLEPIQGEAGIQLPTPEYLRCAQDLCRHYGTLLVLDEVQTGMYRTGRFLAAHHYGVEPDMVVLAKALSGGLVPSGAVLMSDEIHDSVFGSLAKAIVHTSTYSENSLAMRAGLATLDVMDREQLGDRATLAGEYLRERLREALSGFEMVKEVRGIGLFNGIEFRPPEQFWLRTPFEGFRRIHPGMFGQMLVMRLFRDAGVLTQMCGNNFMVLKAAPPLIVTEKQMDHFVRSIREVVEAVHSSGAFWAHALDLGRRAMNV